MIYQIADGNPSAIIVYENMLFSEVVMYICFQRDDAANKRAALKKMKNQK